MINRILEAICAVILAVAVLIAFVSVIFRYVLGSSLSWSFEASIGMLTYLTFIGCYLAMRKNSHLRVDVFVNKLPRLGQFAVFALNQLLIVGIAWVMVYHGGRQAYLFADSPTLVMELPSGILYAIIPISGLLMGIDSMAGLVAGWHRLMNGGPAFVVEPTSEHMDI
ncbi:MAG: TRAP transporter small permease [Rhodospirillales bacterium]|jgi:TRAP-type transport system small permease protein|nr:TRAP transporter small permease [Rhodospirillales bacterium]